MGYTTTFENGFTFNKPVTFDLYRRITEFAQERHEPRNGFPGCWCQWVIVKDDVSEDSLVWDECEKFYNYVEWLEYLIENFFKPEGYVLNGSVGFQGEDSDDFGTIEVVDNVVTQHFGIHVMDLSEIETENLVKELNRRGYSVSPN